MMLTKVSRVDQGPSLDDRKTVPSMMPFQGFDRIPSKYGTTSTLCGALLR